MRKRIRWDIFLVVATVYILSPLLILLFPRSAVAGATCFVPAPYISVNPGSIDFGTTNAGSTSVGYIQVIYHAACVNLGPNGTNCGCTPPSSVTVNMSAATDGNSGLQMFTYSGANSITAKDGTPVSVQFDFSPPAGKTATYTGTGTLTPSSGAPLTFSMVGIGYQAQGIINVTPTSFDFNPVTVNSTWTMTLAISNSGDKSISGNLSTSAPFSISPTTFSLAPGGSTNISVRFSPTSRGAYSNEIQVSSNASNAPSFALTVTGSGVAPYLSISPASYDFGAIPLGENKSTAFMISNLNGDCASTVDLSNIQVSGSGFSLSGSSSLSLDPGESTTLSVLFGPSSVGLKSGTFSFSSNDPYNLSKSISVTGTGVSPAIDPSTLNISFGNVHIDTTAVQTLTLTNKGQASLKITNVVSSDSSVKVLPTSATIAPGGSQNFSVSYLAHVASFDTLNTTVLNASLTISSNDPQLPTLVVGMTGKAVSPRLLSQSIDFGTVYVGDTRTVPLVLTNDGNEALVVTNIVSSNPLIKPTQTSVTIPAGIADQPPPSFNIPVQYSPNAAGSDSTSFTFTSNSGYNYNVTAATGVAVSQLDLAISHLEITQAIQNDYNTLPLVAKKTTFVRTMISSTIKGLANESNTIKNVDGLLHILKNGSELHVLINGKDKAVSPLQSDNGPISVVPHPSRNNVNDTLNFKIPSEWLDTGEAVAWTFTVEVNPESGGRVARFLENEYGNNVATTSHRFTKTYSPLIHYIPVSYKHAALPSLAVMNEGAELLRKIYPVSTIRYVRRPPLAFNKDISDAFNTEPYKSNNSELLRALFIASHLGGGEPPDRTYGWLSANAGSFGLGWTPGRAAFGGSADIEYGKEVFAHEIGHNYGLCHDHETNCPTGMTDGHQLSDGVVDEVGFDTESDATIHAVPLADYLSCMSGWVNATPKDSNSCPGEGYIDVMSYGPPKYRKWISSERYTLLFTRLRDEASDPSKAYFDCNPNVTPSCIAAGYQTETLLLSGTVRPNGASELDSIYRTNSVPDATLDSGTSPYTLRMVDASGNTLVEYPVGAGGTGGDAATQASDDGSLHFDAIIADDPDAVKVQILREGAVVAERSKTNHPPVVVMTSPKGGDLVQGVLEASWSGTDEDNDSLLYSVLYSKNGGQTFDTIAVDIQTNSLQYDTSMIGGSSAAVIRVVATDGFNTVSVDSQSFQVTSKPPHVTITSPKDNETVFSGIPVSLEADVTDPEDGPIDPKHVQWTSNSSGDLGNANPLTVFLPVGPHTLTAQATDSDGNTASQSIHIFVVDGATAPRADAGLDQTVDEGDLVSLDASGSVSLIDGSTLNYLWTQTAGPQVVLDDPTSMHPSFKMSQAAANTSLQFLLTVTDQAGNVGTDSVAITVLNVYYPLMKISPAVLDFGTVKVGDSLSQHFSISNQGNEDLVVSNLSSSRAVFSVDPISVTIAAGQSADFQVVFKPDEAAIYQASLDVASNTVAGGGTSVLLKGAAPQPEITHDDANRGDLLPSPDPASQPQQPAIPPAEPSDSPPQGSPSGEASDPSVSSQPDHGTFGIVGIGGCSLIHD